MSSDAVIPFYSHSKGQYKVFSNFYTPAVFSLKTAELLAPLFLSDTQKDNLIETYGNTLNIKFSEQAFMLGKAFAFYYAHHGNPCVVDQIIKANTPSEVKRLGGKGSLQCFDDKVWAPIREQIMYIACLGKFSQNAELRTILLSTGNHHLVEAAPRDMIWGVGMSINDPQIMYPNKWKGLNLLGKTLMKVRESLKDMNF